MGMRPLHDLILRPCGHIMPVDTRSCPPPTVSPLLRPGGLCLIDLPTEMLNIIANYLGSTDLRNLRALNNRTVRDGIDHVWVRIK